MTSSCASMTPERRLADAAALLEAPVVLASPAVPAALNHAALACEALAARGSGCAGLAIGGGDGARVAGPKHCGQRLATPLIQVGEQQMRADGRLVSIQEARVGVRRN